MDKLADIDRRIAELQKLCGALACFADACANDATAACPFLDELYRPLDTPSADRECP